MIVNGIWRSMANSNGPDLAKIWSNVGKWASNLNDSYLANVEGEEVLSRGR